MNALDVPTFSFKGPKQVETPKEPGKVRATVGRFLDRLSKMNPLKKAEVKLSSFAQDLQTTIQNGNADDIASLLEIARKAPAQYLQGESGQDDAAVIDSVVSLAAHENSDVKANAFTLLNESLKEAGNDTLNSLLDALNAYDADPSNENIFNIVDAAGTTDIDALAAKLGDSRVAKELATLTVKSEAFSEKLDELKSLATSQREISGLGLDQRERLAFLTINDSTELSALTTDRLNLPSDLEGRANITAQYFNAVQANADEASFLELQHTQDGKFKFTFGDFLAKYGEQGQAAALEYVNEASLVLDYQRAQLDPADKAGQETIDHQKQAMLAILKHPTLLHPEGHIQGRFGQFATSPEGKEITSKFLGRYAKVAQDRIGERFGMQIINFWNQENPLEQISSVASETNIQAIQAKRSEIKARIAQHDADVNSTVADTLGDVQALNFQALHDNLVELATKDEAELNFAEKEILSLVNVAKYGDDVRVYLKTSDPEVNGIELTQALVSRSSSLQLYAVLQLKAEIEKLPAEHKIVKAHDFVDQNLGRTIPNSLLLRLDTQEVADYSSYPTVNKDQLASFLQECFDGAHGEDGSRLAALIDASLHSQLTRSTGSDSQKIALKQAYDILHAEKPDLDNPYLNLLATQVPSWDNSALENAEPGTRRVPYARYQEVNALMTQNSKIQENLDKAGNFVKNYTLRSFADTVSGMDQLNTNSQENTSADQVEAPSVSRSGRQRFIPTGVRSSRETRTTSTTATSSSDSTSEVLFSANRTGNRTIDEIIDFVSKLLESAVSQISRAQEAS